MKKLLALLCAALIVCVTALAVAEGSITVKKKDLNVNKELNKNVTNILVIMQDGDVTDTMMLASVNSKTGKSVMARLNTALPVEIPEAGVVTLGEVYALGDKKSGGLLVCRTINTLLNMNVNIYVELDVTKLPELVEHIGVLNMQFDEEEAVALDTWDGINELSGEDVLDYVRLKLDTDSPARSRGYDALMQLLYQGLHSGDVLGLASLGGKLLGSMDTNLPAMQAVTLVTAVQAGTDRSELLLPEELENATAESMTATLHEAIYGE